MPSDSKMPTWVVVWRLVHPDTPYREPYYDDFGVVIVNEPVMSLLREPIEKREGEDHE